MGGNATGKDDVQRAAKASIPSFVPSKIRPARSLVVDEMEHLLVDAFLHASAGQFDGHIAAMQVGCGDEQIHLLLQRLRVRGRGHAVDGVMQHTWNI